MAGQRSEAFDRWFTLGSSIVAPVTAISSLMFYFGYVSTRAEYAYFGLDVDTIGLSTTDFVMRSPQSLLVPLLVFTLGGALAALVHTAVLRRVRVVVAAGRGAASEAFLTVVHVVLAVGLAVLLAGLVLVLVFPVLRDWPPYDLVTPVLTAAGGIAVAYSLGLRQRVVRQPSVAGHDPAPGGQAARVLIWMTAAACLFWATATLAQWAGLGAAQYEAQHLNDNPSVILDTRERLYLTSPGIQEAALPKPEGQTFRYRYRGLRLLIQSGDRMFLVPEQWSPSDSTLVVRLDDAVRVQFQFVNRPPS